MTHTSRDILIAALLVLIGIGLGWWFFSPSDTGKKTETTETQITWTCAMHPSVQRQEAGQCPICGMDLVPVKDVEDALEGQEVLTMTDHAVRLAGIQTVQVQQAVPEKQVVLPGRVKADERRLSTITARFPGRIEKLHIDFTGASVQKGQVLGTIYAPRLIAAQQELFEALRYRETNPSLYHAARQKLKLWDLTEAQINKIAQQEEPQTVVPVQANQSGIVVERLVAAGDYVEEGTPLFRIADLQQVWIMLEAYESDLPWVQMDNEVHFTLPAFPGRTFEGRITYIDPVVNPNTRTASMRAEAKNPDGQLKPNMLVRGTITAQLAAGKTGLLIPKTAVLWTGERSVVYVQRKSTDKPTFEYREVTLGASTSTHYVIRSGLSEGEEVVAHGIFKVDAAAQLLGKHSMMRAPFQEDTNKLTKTRFTVYGNCGMCKNTIEGAIKDIAGVQQAVWNIDKKVLQVQYDPTMIGLEVLHEHVAASGHDTDKIKAPDEVYEELPDCCHYREVQEHRH